MGFLFSKRNNLNINELLVKNEYKLYEVAQLDSTYLNLPESLVDKTPVVIFYSGTFCPFHQGHIHIIEEAENYFESSDSYELLGIYISPCHTQRLKKKINNSIITPKQRLKMLKDALTEKKKEWMIDLLEISNEDPIDMTLVLFNFRSRLVKAINKNYNNKIRIYALSGSDGYPLLREEFSDNNIFSICVFNRGFTQNNHWDLYKEEFPDKFILIKSEKILEISSSLIRYNIAEGYDFEEILGIEKISRYLLKYNLFKFKIQSSVEKEALTEKSPELKNTLQILEDFMDRKKNEKKSLIKIITLLLREAKIIEFDNHSDVIDFEIKEIGKGKGFYSKVFLLFSIKLKNGNFLSKEIVLKCSNLGLPNTLIDSEFFFLLNFANYLDDINIPYTYLVKIFYKDDDKNKHLYQSLILMEYINDAISFEMEYNFKINEIYKLIDELSTFHAKWWNIQGLIDSLGIPYITDNFYIKRICDIIDHMEEAMDYLESIEGYSRHKKFFQTLNAEKIKNLISILVRDNITICHGDLFVKNILKDKMDNFYFIDWQTANKCSGVADICFLIFMDQDTACSKENKFLLFRYYYQCLSKNGISYKKKEIFLEEVKRGMLLCILLNYQNLLSPLFEEKIIHILDSYFEDFRLEDIFS